MLSRGIRGSKVEIFERVKIYKGEKSLYISG
jgi:hypothetical protein